MTCPYAANGYSSRDDYARTEPMTEIKIYFDTGNAAFTDGSGPEEAARVLRNIAARIEYAGEHIGQVHDINGNRIGSWSASFPTNEDDTP